MKTYGYFDARYPEQLKQASAALHALIVDALVADDTQTKDTKMREAHTYLETIQDATRAIKIITT